MVGCSRLEHFETPTLSWFGCRGMRKQQALRIPRLISNSQTFRFESLDTLSSTVIQSTEGIARKLVEHPPMNEALNCLNDFQYFSILFKRIFKKFTKIFEYFEPRVRRFLFEGWCSRNTL